MATNSYHRVNTSPYSHPLIPPIKKSSDLDESHKSSWPWLEVQTPTPYHEVFPWYCTSILKHIIEQFRGTSAHTLAAGSHAPGGIWSIGPPRNTWLLLLWAVALLGFGVRGSPGQQDYCSTIHDAGQAAVKPSGGHVAQCPIAGKTSGGTKVLHMEETDVREGADVGEKSHIWRGCTCPGRQMSGGTANALPLNAGSCDIHCWATPWPPW